ncbi:uncharacterized protein LOC110014064 [Oryzias latipes]|uniref:uncharacterized protein LOC110014064 n=1 Tax=Oryzias latipes TaxID=8090 RepID=UPI0009DA9A86|nr:uncharacterized protein LOC110014064 [Oryzias latipes]
MLQRHVSQDTPTASRDLGYSGRTSSAPGALPLRSSLTTSVTSAWVIDSPHPKVLILCFLKRRRVSGIEEILEVFLPPPYNFPSRSQQLPTCTKNDACRELLSPPEVPDGLPESLRGQPIVFLHDLTELLPAQSFCLCNSPGHSSLRLPVLGACLWSPTSQPGLVGVFLQFDGIAYFWCPPPVSGVTAATGTRDFATTSPGSSRDNGSGKHGPLGLNVPNLPLFLFEFLSDIGVKD